MRLPHLFAILLVLAPLSASAAEPIDRIVAVVNDGVILQSEMNRAMQNSLQQLSERGIAPPPEDILRNQVLERLILTRVQTQRAQEGGIRVDDRELNEVLTNLAAQNGMNLAQFAEAIRKEGMDYLAIREQIRDEILINRLRSREIESRILVTDQDINLFLANQSLVAQAEYRLSHILIAIPDGAASDVRAQARRKADGLLKRLQDGEEFAQVAIAHSDGQQALAGGDLDWRAGSNLPELFAAELQNMKPGDLSRVLESPSGFHIIRLTDMRGGEERKTVTETRTRHILLQPNALRNEEQTRLQTRELHERLKQGADFTALAREFSDDPGSRADGGDLGWQPPGVFAREFEEAIAALEAGQFSTPFRTSFGWHIATVVDRRTRDTTEESRRARARGAIQNRKAADEYDLWLRRLRAEAYVEYRLKSDRKPDAPAS
jgi:peptidyl-prolyl cis-trans isomerase SurA